MSNPYIENNRGFITASKIKAYIDNPQVYKAIYVDEQSTDFLPEFKAFKTGLLVDKYLLTPDEFDYKFPLENSLKADLIEYISLNLPEVHLTGKEKVEDLKQIIYGDSKVLTATEALLLKDIKREIDRQPLWNWFPEGYEPYQPQVELVDDSTFSLPIKWTLDRLAINPTNKTAIIRDLKTSSSLDYIPSLGSTKFKHQMESNDPYHYKLQMAMYVHLVETTLDLKVEKVIIDAIGTKEPNFYEAYSFDVDELRSLRPQIKTVIQDMIDEKFDNPEITRSSLASNRYYKMEIPLAIQKDFVNIENVSEPSKFDLDDILDLDE